jgi:hypothetical protein
MLINYRRDYFLQMRHMLRKNFVISDEDASTPLPL